MSIGFVLARHPALTEIFIERELDALRVVGVDTRVFALGSGPGGVRSGGVAYPGIPGALRSAARGAWAPGLAGVIRRNGLWRGLRLAAAAADLTEAARRAGVTHVHAHFAYVTADAALLMAQRLGCRYSVSAHAWDLYCTPRAALVARLEGASVVVTCSDANAAYLRQVLPTEAASRVRRVYHGMAAGAGAGERADPPVVLAVGRLEPKKGFVHLLDACALLAAQGIPLRCRVVGEGRERPVLERAIARRGLGGVVALSGAMGPAEVLAELRRASVLAVPSVLAADGDRDAIPNVILEAMAAEVPVVGSRFSGIPEAIEDGVSGLLVEPGHPAALAAAIGRVLVEPGLAAQLVAGGRRALRAKFDPLANARQLAALLGEKGLDAPGIAARL